MRSGEVPCSIERRKTSKEALSVVKKKKKKVGGVLI